MTYIKHILNIATSFVEGDISRFQMELDFPAELEDCYPAMLEENSALAEMLKTKLISEGIDCADQLDDGEFYELIREKLAEALEECGE